MLLIEKVKELIKLAKEATYGVRASRKDGGADYYLGGIYIGIEPLKKRTTIETYAEVTDHVPSSEDDAILFKTEICKMTGYEKEKDAALIKATDPSTVVEICNRLLKLEEAYAKAVVALKKIDEPMKYHHWEDDAYTRAGCFQFVAHSALAELESQAPVNPVLLENEVKSLASRKKSD
jgi:hypothetical protein